MRHGDGAKHADPVLTYNIVSMLPIRPESGVSSAAYQLTTYGFIESRQTCGR